MTRIFIFLTVCACYYHTTSALVVYNPKDIDVVVPILPIIPVVEVLVNETIEADIGIIDFFNDLEKSDTNVIMDDVEILLNETVNYIVSAENKTLSIFDEVIKKALMNVSESLFVRQDEDEVPSQNTTRQKPIPCTTRLCHMYSRFYHKYITPD